MRKIITFISIVTTINITFSQQSLENEVVKAAKECNGNIGVYAKVIETGENINYNSSQKFPMQSVYKFPIAMAILDQVDKGKLQLNQKIQIAKTEIIPRGVSPIREKYPEGNVEITIADLLKYNVSDSDGTACDVLLRVLGGTKKAEKYIHRIGIKDIAIKTTEMVQIAADTIQYRNWATPKAMTEILEIFYSKKVLSKKSKALLLDLMIQSIPGKNRLKGLLPRGTIVAHKTGTSGTSNGLTRATNDVGIITLPNGNHIAITVFISDSKSSSEERELTIAKIAKLCFDYWSKKH